MNVAITLKNLHEGDARGHVQSTVAWFRPQNSPPFGISWLSHVVLVLNLVSACAEWVLNLDLHVVRLHALAT